MIKDITFFASWYGSLVSTFLFSIFLLIYLFTPQKIVQNRTSYSLYQTLPSNQLNLAEKIDHGDGRAILIKQFLESRNSPLATFANDFVSVADFYHLDFRLLPAISMQESNGGRKFPDDSFNPFGFGIYGSKLLRFSSWEESIETVGKALREDYLNEGLHTPEQIMSKYTPPSLAKGGSWAIGVTQFMDELK